MLHSRAEPGRSLPSIWPRTPLFTVIRCGPVSSFRRAATTSIGRAACCSARSIGSRATLLVHMGDWIGYHRLCRRLVEHRDNSSLISVLSLAEVCAAGPIPTDVAEQAVARVEAIVDRVRESHKRFVVNLQGALLYRAGRPADAIHVLEDAMKSGGQGSAEYLAFLAMAEQALGHTAAARASLERYEDHCKRSSLLWDFWTRISHDDLLREARAKILLDPVFPDNPFAGQ